MQNINNEIVDFLYEPQRIWPWRLLWLGNKLWWQWGWEWVFSTKEAIRAKHPEDKPQPPARNAATPE
jgi:hypothetical protein